MAVENAARDVEKRLKSRENPEALEELMEVLGLDNPPKHIEGFDIAQLAGKYTVASLITFEDGNPDRRITADSISGVWMGGSMISGAIREAVTRRYTRQVKEKHPLPDLIMIDGGTGQVHAAKDALSTLGLDDLPVVGLAEQYEDIHFPDERPPLRLPESSSALKVLQAVRDETHRFATSLNQQQRSREATFHSIGVDSGCRSCKEQAAHADFRYTRCASVVITTRDCDTGQDSFACSREDPQNFASVANSRISKEDGRAPCAIMMMPINCSSRSGCSSVPYSLVMISYSPIRAMIERQLSRGYRCAASE